MTRHPLADPDARLVIAHRGDRAHAPENTLEALVCAEDLGADALEFDVRCTRDGVPVLMHDATVDRTTGGRGLVAEHTLADVRALDASHGNAVWAGGRAAVPTLEEVLDRFQDVPLVLDVKEMAVVEPALALVHKFGRQGSVVVGSDAPDVAATLYRSGVAACASTLDVLLLAATCLVGLWPRSPRYSVLSLTPRPGGWRLPVSRMTAAARRAGVATHVWTVNDPAEAASLWRAGVSSIITDDPAAILSAKPR